MSKPKSTPLWRLLHRAHLEEAGMIQYSNGTEPVLGEPDHFTRAAEIRAVAAWIEERQVDDYAVLLPEIREVIEWLTTEAERAERGE